MNNSEIFIVGANGQLGTALQAKYPGAKKADIAELDIANQQSVNSYNWQSIKYILNAAAYTNVDGAETKEGRVTAWKVNAVAASYLSEVARQNNITLFHVSTDYVFDGTKTPHSELETFSPLGVYGASKAAGDIAISQAPKHYILRTSWVIGEGKNFVRTMLEIGKKGISPEVVADQIGRLTFTSELVKAIDLLLKKQPAYGTYNVSNSGDPTSWANITRAIFLDAKLNLQVTDITTQQYFQDKKNVSPRPAVSTLDLTKIQAVGFEAVDWKIDLKRYIKKEQEGGR